jgi:hypothetical protein
MIIDDLASEYRDGRKRISATVQWEDCDRPSYDLYFETDEAHADGLSCNPHAFLVGCIIPAFHYGEQRILIGGEICAELKEGITVVQRIMRHWYYDKGKQLVRIESKSKPARNVSNSDRKAGFFFSGGIDSYATLCANRKHYPSDHARAIKDGFVVFGLEQDDPDLFEHVLTSLRKAGGAAGLDVVPVYTNVYLHFRNEDAANEFRLWQFEFGGAALAAVAHAFSKRNSLMSIAGTYSFDNQEPWGTHPLIDPNFSSSDMRIIHDGFTLTRFDKIKLVAGWDVALEHLRVCNKYKHYHRDMLNCGQCEKCIRTMLGLLAVGALSKTTAFPVNDVSAELVRKKVNILDDFVFLKPIYDEIIPRLMARDRHDLVNAIQEKMIPPKEFLFKNGIIQFDKTHLNSNLARLKKWIFRKGNP